MKRLIRKVITKIKEGYLKEIYRETLWMYQYAKNIGYPSVFIYLQEYWERSWDWVPALLPSI